MNTKAKEKRPIPQSILFITFLSGLIALMYELLWTRVMTLLFGATGITTVIVFALFLIGIGIGSYLFGKVSQRVKNPLQIYAIIEGAIALLTTLGYLIATKTTFLTNIHSTIYNQHPSFLLISNIFFAAIFLLPSFILIGGTIPLLARKYTTKETRISHPFSGLYGMNTLGSVVGAIVTGLIFIPLWGTLGAISIGIIGNCILALFAFHISTKTNTESSLFKKAAKKTNTRSTSHHLWFLYFCTGAIVMAYEVVIIRITANTTGTTIFSSSLILASIILGLGLGSYGYYIKSWDKKPTQQLIQKSVFYVGIFISLLLIILPHIIQWTRSIYADPIELSFPFSITSIIILGISNILIMIPLGIIFPLGHKLTKEYYAHIGDIIGKQYLANVLGTLAGLAGGIITLIFFGYKGSVLFILAIIIILYIRISSKTVWKQKTIWILLGTTLLFSVFFSNTGFLYPQEAVVDHFKEGTTGTVSIVANPYNTSLKQLQIDNQGVAGTSVPSMIDQKLLAHLPMQLLSYPAKNVVTIGFGTGVTSRTYNLYGVNITTIEIEPEVMDASVIFTPQNEESYNQKNVTVIIDDGRHFLQATNQSFDIIVTDVTNLKYKSNPYLYTREFFSTAKNRLNEKGIVATWAPLGGISFTDITIIIHTFQEVFPHTTVWVHSGAFVTLIGSQEPLQYNVDSYDQLPEHIKKDMATIQLIDGPLLGSALLLGEEDLVQLTKTAQIHTDNKPILESSDLYDYFEFNNANNLGKLYRYQKENRQNYFIGSDNSMERLRQLFLVRDQAYEDFYNSTNN